jgi:hypothetical protein
VVEECVVKLASVIADVVQMIKYAFYHPEQIVRIEMGIVL